MACTGHSPSPRTEQRDQEKTPSLASFEEGRRRVDMSNVLTFWGAAQGIGFFTDPSRLPDFCAQ